MITDRPCCDNCPHFAVDQAACGEPQEAGFCLYDSPSAIFDDQGKPKVAYYHVTSSHRCSNHPFIAWVTDAMDGLIFLSVAKSTAGDEWNRYLEGLRALAPFFGRKADEEPKP